MALLKEGSLSLENLWEKSILFISLIWYQQMPEKGQSLMERLFFNFTHLRSKLEDERPDKATHGVEGRLQELDPNVLWDKSVKTREDIIKSLHQTFHPDNYIPVLSELKATCTEKYDFEEKFEILVKPLKDHGLLVEEIREFYITDKGGKHLESYIKNFKYYNVHSSDEVLLAMSREQ